MNSNLALFFAAASFVGMIISLGFCIGTFIRGNKWRETDDGKLLVARIERAEKWDDSEKGKLLFQTQLRQGERLTTLETSYHNLATKADIAKLEGEVNGLTGSVDDTKELVGKIHDWIMRDSRG